MTVAQFVDRVVMLMRNDEIERGGWDENCIFVGSEGVNRIVVAFKDGSEFELEVRNLKTDLRPTGLAHWFVKMLRGLKRKKSGGTLKVVRRACGAHSAI